MQNKNNNFDEYLEHSESSNSLQEKSKILLNREKINSVLIKNAQIEQKRSKFKLLISMVILLFTIIVVTIIIKLEKNDSYMSPTTVVVESNSKGK